MDILRVRVAIHLDNKRLTQTLIASLDKNPRVPQELAFDHDTIRGEKIWPKKLLHDFFFTFLKFWS